MRWSSSFLLALAISLAAAHVDPTSPDHGYHVPKIFGGRTFLSELRGRRALGGQVGGLHPPHVTEGRPDIQHRDDSSTQDPDANTNGRCGATRGSCAAGYCCSAEGWCGKGTDYCEAPDCQMNYGPGCDANQKPDGDDTSSISRSRFGKIPYGGVGVYDCVNKGDIAITFDDGPYNYTNDLLDKFKKWGGHATFFITGNNLGKGMINDPDLPWRAVIQRMAAEGHQIASHTWSHQNYSQLTEEQFKNQMIWNEIAFNDILGYFPTYMRPPFSICPAACQTQLISLGYHEIYFDLDTEGYLNDDPTLIQNSKDIWDEAVDGSNPCKDSFLNIEHDIHYQSVYNLTDYFLESLFAHGYRSVTVGQCLGDSPENWYRAANSDVPEYTFTIKQATGTYSCLTGIKTSPTITGTSTRTTTTRSTTRTSTTPTATVKVSNDGTCAAGVTCKGSKYGNCCSANGWCGASVDYCGSGCQPANGVCFVGDSTIPARREIFATPTGPGVPDSPLSTSSGSSSASAPAATSTGALDVSSDGSCGGSITCAGSLYGSCCSAHGWCGADEDYCGDGCQSAFGSGCLASGGSSSSSSSSTAVHTTTSTTPASPTSHTTTRTTAPPTTVVTTTITRTWTGDSSTTGVITSVTTLTPPGASPPSHTITTRLPALVPSRNGRCGPGTGETCRGSGFGTCCTSLNRCALLCLPLIQGCQPDYGTCLVLIGPNGEESMGAE